MDDHEEQIHPGSMRTRRRRARLKEAGVLTFNCEFGPAVGEALCRAAEIANVPPSHLIEMIVSRHFERALAGQKRQPIAPKADGKAPHEVAG